MSTENPEDRGLFDNVPAILPDWSNAEEIFYHIDFNVFGNHLNATRLSQMATCVNVTDLKDQTWYAVHMLYDQWWLIYVYGGEWYTIGSLAGDPKGARFHKCTVIEKTCFTVAVAPGVLPVLPEHIIASANLRCPYATLPDQNPPSLAIDN